MDQGFEVASRFQPLPGDRWPTTSCQLVWTKVAPWDMSPARRLDLARSRRDDNEVADPAKPRMAAEFLEPVVAVQGQIGVGFRRELADGIG